MVTTDNGANLDYMNSAGEIVPQHYAFLVGDAEFDAIFDRIRKRNLPYWADPGRKSPVKRTTTTVGAVSISRIRTVTFWKLSRVPMAAAVGTRERQIAKTALH